LKWPPGYSPSAGSAYLAQVARRVALRAESIAYQVRDVVEAIDHHLGDPLEAIWADGGATQNDWLMQFQADMLGRPVLRNLDPEVAVLGVGAMAGLATGTWVSRDELAHLPRTFDRFDSVMGTDERGRLYSGWLAAVEQARCHSRADAERYSADVAS
jgi:glycerol kinase